MTRAGLHNLYVHLGKISSVKMSNCVFSSPFFPFWTWAYIIYSALILMVFWPIWQVSLVRSGYIYPPCSSWPGEHYREVPDWSTGRGKLDVSQLSGLQMVSCPPWDPLFLHVSTVIRIIGGKCDLPHTASQHSHHMSPHLLIVWHLSLLSAPSHSHRTGRQPITVDGGRTISETFSLQDCFG